MMPAPNEVNDAFAAVAGDTLAGPTGYHNVTLIFLGVGVTIGIVAMLVLTVRCVQRRRENPRSAPGSPANWANGHISLEEHTKALARYRNKEGNHVQRASMESIFNPSHHHATVETHGNKSTGSERLVEVATLLNRSMDPGDDGSIMAFKFQEGDGRQTVTSPGGRVAGGAGAGGSRTRGSVNGQGLIERSSAFSPSGGKRHASYEHANYNSSLFDSAYNGYLQVGEIAGSSSAASGTIRDSAFSGEDNRTSSYVAANRSLARVGSRSDLLSNNKTISAEEATQIRVATEGGQDVTYAADHHHRHAPTTTRQQPLLFRGGDRRSISDYSSNASPEPEPEPGLARYALQSAPAASWASANAATNRSSGGGRGISKGVGRVVENGHLPVASVRGIPIRMATFGGPDMRQNSYNSAIGRPGVKNQRYTPKGVDHEGPTVPLSEIAGSMIPPSTRQPELQHPFQYQPRF